eukprot:CAMPEP_0194181354 /NCGR_PEP_ID=MMETSP0154-20130528/20068_1 /TAXON_ID=1049557 /ORGANISM="Thalassiothrix antarctica, Strain L6-D1" /LENGTH=248 /DNA_ID=CAMNT_0038897303 /DNA_START=76 /DNA_END=822 /DNA_ORIENTATION=-
MNFQINQILIFSIICAFVLSRINAEDEYQSAPITSPPITLPPVAARNPRPDFRCGTNENHARTTCGRICLYLNDCDFGEYCWGTFPNTCYASELALNGYETDETRQTTESMTDAPITLAPITAAPTASSPVSAFPPRSDYRCGVNEEDSRTNCGKLCVNRNDCDINMGEYCWSTFPNKCYLPPAPTDGNTISIPEDAVPKSDFRCGINEGDARGNCGKVCGSKIDCESSEHCFATLANFCYAKEERTI